MRDTNGYGSCLTSFDVAIATENNSGAVARMPGVLGRGRCCLTAEKSIAAASATALVGVYGESHSCPFFREKRHWGHGTKVSQLQVIHQADGEHIPGNARRIDQCTLLKESRLTTYPSNSKPARYWQISKSWFSIPTFYMKNRATLLFVVFGVLTLPRQQGAMPTLDAHAAKFGLPASAAASEWQPNGSTSQSSAVALLVAWQLQPWRAWMKIMR